MGGCITSDLDDILADNICICVQAVIPYGYTNGKFYNDFVPQQGGVSPFMETTTFRLPAMWMRVDRVGVNFKQFKSENRRFRAAM